MFEYALAQYAFQLGYLQALAADIDESQFAHQPLPGLNHPAWILGHLAMASDYVPKLLGQASGIPENWLKLFGPGSQPLTDRVAYPTKSALLSTLPLTHQRAAEVIVATPVEVFSRPNPSNIEALKSLPTLGNLLTHLITTHEATHIGHLSFWRRAMGLPALF